MTLYLYFLETNRYVFLEKNVHNIQLNLSKANTMGTNIFVRFRQVSALDRLGLWDFDQ